MSVQGHQQAALLVVSCIYAILWTMNIDTLTMGEKTSVCISYTCCLSTEHWLLMIFFGSFNLIQDSSCSSQNQFKLEQINILLGTQKVNKFVQSSIHSTNVPIFFVIFSVHLFKVKYCFGAN